MVRDPVGVPALAFVEREGLLPDRGALRDPLPGEADAVGHALVHVVALEDADPLAEAADDRLVELALPDRRGPPDPPQARAGVEQPEREALETGPARKARRLES